MSWTHDDGDSPWWGLSEAGARPVARNPVKEEIRTVIREMGAELRGIGAGVIEGLGLSFDNATVVDAATFTIPHGNTLFCDGVAHSTPHWYRYEAKWPRVLLLVLDTPDGREGWLIWLGEEPHMFEHFETLDWEDDA